jgi:hypothetical protein
MDIAGGTILGNWSHDSFSVDTNVIRALLAQAALQYRNIPAKAEPALHTG